MQAKKNWVKLTMAIAGILLLFIISTAHALQTITIDPGTPGEEAQDFDFGLLGEGPVQVLFADNKTIKWNAGSHSWRSPGIPATLYDGFFLDGTLDPTTTPFFYGQAATAGLDYTPDYATTNLAEAGVFRGLLFDIVAAPGGGTEFGWTWDPNDRPLVGQLDASGNQPPIAEAGEPVTGTVDVAVAFDGSASIDPDGGDITQYDWDFGDGSDALIDGGPTPSHTYTASGTYNVILTVTDEEGLTDSDNVTATIGEASTPPTANAGGPYTGTAGVEVWFDGRASNDPDGNPLQYDWDFGDGSDALIDGGATPTYIYAASGEYAVVLTVTDDDAETDSATTTATITFPNQPPVADAGQPVVGAAGMAVTFDGSLSVDVDGTIVQYDWYFGDGNKALDAGPTPTHTYQEAGLYSVNLTVTDDGGLPASDSTTARIGESSQPPTADAKGPYNGQVDVAVSFDGSASNDPDGTIEQYDWDFGDPNDSTPGTGATPTHIYNDTGKYIVKLTVTDDSGETDTDVTFATVGIGNLPPQADAGGQYTGAPGVAVTFDGTGSTDPDGTIEFYDWDFGDGSDALIDGGPTPTHVYDESGTYFVTLTVTDNDNATNSDATLATISSRFECVEECRAEKFECLDAADAAKETCIELCGDDRICKRACRADARAEKTTCRADFRACRTACR